MSEEDEDWKEEEEEIFEYLKENEWRIEVLNANENETRNENEKNLEMNYEEDASNFFLNLNLKQILLEDFEFFKLIIQKNGMYLSLFFNDNEINKLITKDIGLIAVQQNGLSLKYLNEELRNDFDIILNSVKQNGNTLEYIPNKFKNNFMIVFEAIKQNSKSIRFLNENEEMIKNEEIIEECLIKNEKCFTYLNEKSKNDRDLMLKCLKKNRRLFYFLDENLKKDKEFYLIFNRMYSSLNSNNSNFIDIEIIFDKDKCLSES
eukprot:gene12406-6073_t